jgi:hypothetical protein
MKIKHFAYISAAFLLCSNLSAGDTKINKYTLPDGKVLINPYVISHTPYALEVGHKNGVLKVPLKSLPLDIQKKYGYSPKKAEEFIAKKEKNEAAWKKKEAAKAKKKAIQSEKFRKMRLGATIESLTVDIKKTELRINELKKEIPNLESEKNNLLDKSTSLAATSVSQDNGRRTSYSWDGGVFYTNGGNSPGNKAERTKKKQISRLDDDYATVQHRLRTYKKELQKKEGELLEMKSRLSNLKNAQANEKK